MRIPWTAKVADRDGKYKLWEIEDCERKPVATVFYVDEDGDEQAKIIVLAANYHQKLVEALEVALLVCAMRTEHEEGNAKVLEARALLAEIKEASK